MSFLHLELNDAFDGFSRTPPAYHGCPKTCGDAVWVLSEARLDQAAGLLCSRPPVPLASGSRWERRFSAARSSNARSARETCRRRPGGGGTSDDDYAGRPCKGRVQEDITMPVATHTKAAEQHTSAAAEHKAAADLHGKGQHDAALEKSKQAQSCCDSAKTASSDAHCKSSARAEK